MARFEVITGPERRGRWEFAGKARLRIPASIPTGLAAAVVKALSGQ
jgi:hypothetical protein